MIAALRRLDTCSTDSHYAIHDEQIIFNWGGGGGEVSKPA